MRNVRGFIGAWLVQWERRAVQLMSLAALVLALVFVTLPPFTHTPTHPKTKAKLAIARPKVTAPLKLPKPDPADEEAAAVLKIAKKGLAVRGGGATHRWVALTFDDGPGPYTQQMLGILEKLHVPATFFQVGKEITQFPQAANQTSETPDIVIGDHTYDHASMPSLGSAGQKQEILQTAAIMQQHGESAPRLFRPPYGSWDAHTRALTRERGMAIILWNVDSEDYTRPGVDKIVQNVMSEVKPGSIVLMHDAGGDRTQTLAAVPKIVKKLRAQGYGFVSVEKLLTDDPPTTADDFGTIGQVPSGAAGG